MLTMLANVRDTQGPAIGPVSSTKFASSGGKSMHGTTSRPVNLSQLGTYPPFCVALVSVTLFVRLNGGHDCWRQTSLCLGAPAQGVQGSDAEAHEGPTPR